MQNRTSVHRQRVTIVASVLLLHGLALWALQTGLLQRVLVLAEEIVVPVEFIEPVVQPVSKPPPVLPKPLPSIKTPIAAPTPTAAPPVAAAPAPIPLAIADPTPSANAPVGVAHAPAVVAPMVTAPSAPAPTPAPALKLELPSSDAEYLHNPKPRYPSLSVSRNEQGKVVVSVFIGIDGAAQKAEIKVSSGFERLDQAALATAKSWRYVPGKRGGVPEAMWFNVPINFVLE